MADVLFRNPPHLKLLQQLAKGPLEQSHHLTRAVRLWTLLRWLYGEWGYTALPDCFTYGDWRKAFFTETHKDEKQEEILNHQDSSCACTKTTAQWLSVLEVPTDEWQRSLQQQISIANDDLKDLLEEQLFAQVRKSLQSDLDLLVSWGWLQRIPSDTARSKKYCRVKLLPILNESQNLSTQSNLSASELASLAQALDMLSFLDPKLSLLAENISEQVHGTRHIFLHIDYVVPESTQKQDEVEQLQEELQEIWGAAEIKPVQLTYHSAHLQLIKECVVYPACIYYMERAKYLCAYGSTPKGEINWHNYRLDRICSQRLVSLDWLDPRVPQLLLEKYQDKQLPTPEIVQAELKRAWGFDFYKQSALMVLRFDQDFHDRYMQGIFLHNSFTPIGYEQTADLLRKYTQKPEHRQALLEILQSRPPVDAYYKARYRVGDYHVIRRLRALGSKVEVLLPWDLRHQMALDIQDTWNLYK